MDIHTERIMEKTIDILNSVKYVRRYYSRSTVRIEVAGKYHVFYPNGSIWSITDRTLYSHHRAVFSGGALHGL